MYLPDEEHERLWRICDALVTGAGARGVMICEASGAIVVSVGDLSAQGTPQGVDLLGPGERLVRGEGGNVYGVDVPGGVLLAVLHDPPALARIRTAAAETVRLAAELIAALPPPPPPPPMPHEAHHHQHPTQHQPEPPKTRTRTSTKKKPAPKKKKGRTAKARPSKSKAKKKPSPRPRRRARPRSTRT